MVKLFIVFLLIFFIIWLDLVLFLYFNLIKGLGYVIIKVEKLILVVLVILSVKFVLYDWGLFEIVFIFYFNRNIIK